MKTELQKEIFNYMVGNNDFQLVNNASKRFRPYIYDNNGAYCIGGEQVMNFIREIDRLLRQ